MFYINRSCQAEAKSLPTARRLIAGLGSRSRVNNAGDGIVGVAASSAAASSVSRRVAYWVCHCGRTKAANFDDVLARPVWECGDSGLDCLRH